MKTQITMHATPAGYTLDVAGKFGGGYRRHLPANDIPAAVAALRDAISRYLDTNAEGGEYLAPPEILAAMDATPGAEKPARGKAMSYYASPAALVAIQSEREATGNSTSGAINALILRGAELPAKPEIGE